MAADSDKIISLNVGGVKFATSLETLTRVGALTITTSPDVQVQVIQQPRQSAHLATRIVRLALSAPLLGLEVCRSFS